MVTPERISLARKRRSLTTVELARRLGLSAQSVTNYEHGRQQPSERTLQVLATELSFPEAFFHQPCCDEVPDGSAAFRARSQVSQRKRAAALSAGTIAAEVNAWLENLFTLPAADIPTLERPDPETAADMTRARWGLGNSPLPNLIHLLEARGVRVFSLPREHTDVDAFSFWHHGTPYIMLNMAKTPERSRFDAAHELGHLVMHGGAKHAHGPVAEQEANTFAGALLMPSTSIRAAMPHAPLLDQVVTTKRHWSVSALALTYRLHEVGLLSDWQYRSMCVELSRCGYRSSERQGIERESSQLLSKVLTALRRSGRTMQDVAAAVHLTPDELSSLMFGLVMMSVEGGSQASVTPSQARDNSAEHALTLV
ncbi:Zn-dependent peptidase ImmA, M78 family [Haloechinothrix alba]|uniref:Zn-dependent peptidase ImmA, M78 family n=1 Tax=Haloechinothrix alba TaxID=664784 RepID=A0A238WK41_9PSEU|nr:XRE family transcriptional regulator [Haloechinothrix alba]SNR46930.1 Zn-dependent peptidase ImmA, M78 family [Haloechinothrix alba]